MSLETEIKRLGEAARDIAEIQEPNLRHRGGFWLNNELEHLFSRNIFTPEERLDFMAVVKVMLNVIFRDATENGGSPASRNPLINPHAFYDRPSGGKSTPLLKKN